MEGQTPVRTAERDGESSRSVDADQLSLGKAGCVELTAMGFDCDEALKALRAHDGNISHALDYLLAANCSDHLDGVGQSSSNGMYGLRPAAAPEPNPIPAPASSFGPGRLAQDGPEVAVAHTVKAPEHGSTQPGQKKTKTSKRKKKKSKARQPQPEPEPAGVNGSARGLASAAAATVAPSDHGRWSPEPELTPADARNEGPTKTAENANHGGASSIKPWHIAQDPDLETVMGKAHMISEHHGSTQRVQGGSLPHSMGKKKTGKRKPKTRGGGRIQVAAPPEMTSAPHRDPPVLLSLDPVVLPVAAVEVGTRVVLHSLVARSGAKLNGTPGEICGALDTATWRVNVRVGKSMFGLVETGKERQVCNVKLSNLVLLPPGSDGTWERFDSIEPPPFCAVVFNTTGGSVVLLHRHQ